MLTIKVTDDLGLAVLLPGDDDKEPEAHLVLSSKGTKTQITIWPDEVWPLMKALRQGMERGSLRKCDSSEEDWVKRAREAQG